MKFRFAVQQVFSTFPTWLSESWLFCAALMGVVSAPILSGYQAGRALNCSFSMILIETLLTIYANGDFFAAELRSVRTFVWWQCCRSYALCISPQT